jgi:hypothetical protein
VTQIPGDRLRYCLDRVCGALERAGLWYTLAYGTLLGAVRDGDLIPWDHDIDLLVREEEVPRVLAIRIDGFRFSPTTRDAGYLAINPGRICNFWTGAIAILHHGRKVGDLYAFTRFADGVLRRYDRATGAYWCPHSSFPAFFVEERASVDVRGRSCAVPAHAERWLEATYGADWRVPYRSVLDGGRPRAGVTNHGDRYEPTLAEQVAWARARGWDPTSYAGSPAWPQPIGGAGPRGPTARTVGSTGSLWWRDLEELVRHH